MKFGSFRSTELVIPFALIAMLASLRDADGVVTCVRPEHTTCVAPGEGDLDGVVRRVVPRGAFAEVVIDSGTQAGGLSWQEIGLRLKASSSYFARGRARDAEGAWSPWSAAVSFSTAASFVYVQTPSNVGPAMP